jgi:hypothetical protein
VAISAVLHVQFTHFAPPAGRVLLGADDRSYKRQTYRPTDLFAESNPQPTKEKVHNSKNPPFTFLSIGIVNQKLAQKLANELVLLFKQIFAIIPLSS